MSKKYNKAVFFDIDGTLIEHGKEKNLPPESAKRAIEQLRQKGILVIIATGRANAYIPDLGLAVDGYVSFNGAAVCIDEKVVFQEMIAPQITTKVIDFFQSRGLDYLIETIDGCFFGGEADKNFYWIGENISRIEEYPDDITKMQAAKVSAPYNEQILDEFGEMFVDSLDFIPHRYDNFMDIGPKGVTKATGVKKVLELYGIDVHNSYAFGDDTNDLEMLKSVGHAVAMTPCAKCLEKVAEHITNSVSEDGIYNALKHYGLID